MCGIAGFVAKHQGDLRFALEPMLKAIVHRGPDASGVWIDPVSGVALGHRRLSILDLSSAGHQPMISSSGRWVIVFNGEIYNHTALRRELQLDAHVDWRGHSDTETLLAAVERWGAKGALQRSVGMFALALWDRSAHTLTLARDRIGEKPLYYGWQGRTFLFGSELKALRAHPAWQAEIDRAALSLYMRHNAVPAPKTIFRDMYKLPAATLLTLPFGIGTLRPGALPRPEFYWRVSDVIARGLAGRWQGTAEDAITELDNRLRESIRDQMIADVPLGAFLSGGVDSSTVVALMQEQSARPVKTFSIGFHEEALNEAHHALAVAQHLGTEHTELYVTAEDALAVIPSLPAIYDEPFADSSQIPTCLVAKLARQHVTVSLSGDAGDELFGGYNRYLLGARMWGALSKVPMAMRQAGAAMIEALSPAAWDRMYAFADPLLPAAYRQRQPGDKLHKAAAVIASGSREALYRQLISHWEPSEIVTQAVEPSSALSSEWASLELVEQMMAWDSVHYLPDDILVKLDRAAMAVSLETRVPFLDHRVVEFAWRLPLSLKIRGAQGKWILRQVLYRYVPQALIERPKMGFGVPIDSWLRGPLKQWAEALLDEARLRREGFLHSEPIRRKWVEHQSGRRNWQHHLWNVLMFQSWLERWR